jgi:NADPH:quinone reductase-like Zn-dependent oxidoreductase
MTPAKDAMPPGGGWIGVEDKAAICAAVVEHVWPLVADGTVQPIIGARVPMAEAGRAHALMESGESSGKILLTVS